jgi:hypothetical protein
MQQHLAGAFAFATELVEIAVAVACLMLTAGPTLDTFIQMNHVVRWRNVVDPVEDKEVQHARRSLGLVALKNWHAVMHLGSLCTLSLQPQNVIDDEWCEVLHCTMGQRIIWRWNHLFLRVAAPPDWH